MPIDRTGWRRVENGEPLEARIYEYSPDTLDDFFAPAKICTRDDRSITTSSPTTRDRARDFRDALLRRDMHCVVTGDQPADILIASHLIPRRLGDHVAQSVVDQFVASGTIPLPDCYNPQLGLLLLSTLDTWVDIFRIGFWHIGDVSLSSTFHTRWY